MIIQSFGAIAQVGTDWLNWHTLAGWLAQLGMKGITVSYRAKTGTAASGIVSGDQRSCPFEKIPNGSALITLYLIHNF